MRVFIFILLFSGFKSMAIRPFITDDARVVGWHYGQYESWLRFDAHAWQHWNMLAYGPSEKWEVALGFVHGSQRSSHENKYSFAIPLLQAKYLIKEYTPNGLPGVAVAMGSFLPGGRGEFKAPGYGGFGFVAITQCFGDHENVLIHGNVGGSMVKYPETDHSVITWGVGTQIKTFRGLHTIGEIFSGDPYVPGSGLSFQTGFRHIINDFVQLDFTVGKGLDGENILPFWYGAGVRLVTDHFQKDKNSGLN